ncbi:serine hydrolase domain-containing protein [Corynebacterium sp.]|uniref:serine hydrolase domain-containing protein n=1 Tax=Corynebacterium sp. TaxID=1720 RepID=UPI003B3A89D1
MTDSTVLDALAALLRDRVRDGRLPGAVVAHHRGGGRTDTVAVGVQDLESGTPTAPDSLFFWDSLSKPVTAAVALTLVADGSITLDTPVSRWLPELDRLSVLRDPFGALADASNLVPCDRAVTVEDLLTLRGGLGFTPDFDSPFCRRLFSSLQEETLGRSVSRDGYLAAAAALPLAHQPGHGWTYNSGSTLLGLLCERVTDTPLDQLTQDRLFAPLGIGDTTWWVDRGRRGRFAARYVDGADGVQLVDSPDGVYAAPPSFPDAAGALVGPVGDWVTFARLLLGGGTVDGVRVLPAELVTAMMTDHLTAADRAMAGFFLADGEGWGYGGSVRPDGSYGWAGAAGTWARVNPRTDEAVVVFTQLALHGPEGGGLFDEVERVVAAAW